MKDCVFVRGGGDLASAVIHKLYRSGFLVAVGEIEKPRMVRRSVSYGNAVYTENFEVEGIGSKRVKDLDEVESLWQAGLIPIVVNQEAAFLERFQPEIFVDATLSKRQVDYDKAIAPIVIGMGPEIIAGVQAHVVIETARGHDLGRLIFEGKAAPNTHEPGVIMGYSSERVLRSPAEGHLQTDLEIGAHVKKGDLLGRVGEEAVIAPLSGVLRGWIHPQVPLKPGMKIGDIDPRDDESYIWTISDKGRNIAGGVLEAIFYCRQFL